ncbi:MAG TPA: winged helix-turn-helix domain-containing protein, partial [Longimicrobiales bacterium]|nr:winged helix-turn-helix domain-containing protein [Longimicrobiales bacterium]
PGRLSVADLELDLVRQRARRAGSPVDLTPKELALLAFLARRRDEVLSRAMIAREVWGVTLDGDSNVIDVAIRRLRAKVDEPFARPLIHTVRGVGYVLREG